LGGDKKKKEDQKEVKGGRNIRKDKEILVTLRSGMRSAGGFSLRHRRGEGGEGGEGEREERGEKAPTFLKIFSPPSYSFSSSFFSFFFFTIMSGGGDAQAVVLATAGYDHTIRFWEALSGICYRTLQFPDSVMDIHSFPFVQFLHPHDLSLSLSLLLPPLK